MLLKSIREVCRISSTKFKIIIVTTGEQEKQQNVQDDVSNYMNQISIIMQDPIIKNLTLTLQQDRKELKKMKKNEQTIYLRCGFSYQTTNKQFLTLNLIWVLILIILESVSNLKNFHELQEIQQNESFNIRIRKYSLSNFDDSFNYCNPHQNLVLE